MTFISYLYMYFLAFAQADWMSGFGNQVAEELDGIRTGTERICCVIQEVQECVGNKWSSLEVTRRFDEPQSLILLEHGKAGMGVTVTQNQIFSVWLVARHPGFICHLEGPCIVWRTLNRWFLSTRKTVSDYIVCGFDLYGLFFRDSSHLRPQWL